MKRILLILLLVFNVGFTNFGQEQVAEMDETGILIENNRQRSLAKEVDNKPDDLEDMGVTATSAEINILEGLTATTTELNYVSGTESNIQDQIDDIGITGTIAFGTYTGTGSSQSISIGWKPDLVEIFRPSNYITWWISDEMDGTTAGFHGATGSAGSAYTVTFDSDGFDTTGSNTYASGVVYYYKAYSI